jgi:hypothetical protein
MDDVTVNDAVDVAELMIVDDGVVENVVVAVVDAVFVADDVAVDVAVDMQLLHNAGHLSLQELGSSNPHKYAKLSALPHDAGSRRPLHTAVVVVVKVSDVLDSVVVVDVRLVVDVVQVPQRTGHFSLTIARSSASRLLQ